MLGITLRAGRGASLAAFGVAVTIAAAAVLMPGVGSAQTEPLTMGIELEQTHVALGSTVEVFVYVDHARSLGGFQFTLAYSPTVLSFVDAEATAFLASTGREVIPLGPLTDTGRVTFGAVSTGEQPGPSGSGDLAVVRFHADGLGTTGLDLSDVLVYDTSDTRQTVEAEDGSLTVIAAATATPTRVAPTGEAATATSSPVPTASETVGRAYIPFSLQPRRR